MVKFDPQKHHRRPIRLPHYDYSQPGAYFVTIVAWHRECLFGEIINHEVKLSHYGEIVQKWWNEDPGHFENVEIGAFIIMPNHVHGIIVIGERRGTASYSQGISVPNDNNYPQTHGGETPPVRIPTLGQIVAYFKYQSTKEMNVFDNTGTVTKFWQRNYYEHVIRDDPLPASPKSAREIKNDPVECSMRIWGRCPKGGGGHRSESPVMG